MPWLDPRNLTAEAFDQLLKKAPFDPLTGAISPVLQPHVVAAPPSITGAASFPQPRRHRQMASINMLDAERMIRAAYKANKPFMMIGSPGMGKTSLYERVAQDLGIGFIDFRLSLKDPVDVGGMRIPDETTGVLKHYPPDDLPRVEKHGEAGMILFDEINTISGMMQATAYGIIQERRVGSYRMPPGWVPMAAGNKTTDGAAAQRLSSALANRFNVQYVAPDLQIWLKQYGSEHVDQRGTAFLRFRPELFSAMPGELVDTGVGGKQEVLIPKDSTAFPSARSWTNAFAFIGEEPVFRRKIFAGYVGEAAADEFEAFWRILEKAPTFERIVNDPSGTPVPDDNDPGLYFAVVGMLARSVTRETWPAVMEYVGRLMAEHQVAFVQDATRRNAGLKVTAEYGIWAAANKDVLL